MVDLDVSYGKVDIKIVLKTDDQWRIQYASLFKYPKDFEVNTKVINILQSKIDGVAGLL